MRFYAVFSEIGVKVQKIRKTANRKTDGKINRKINYQKYEINCQIPLTIKRLFDILHKSNDKDH